MDPEEEYSPSDIPKYEINNKFLHYKKKEETYSLYNFENDLEKKLNLTTLFPKNPLEDLKNFFIKNDDGDYKNIKWTKVPVNTYLLHRQNNKTWRQNVNIWCDYSGRIEEKDHHLVMNQNSFLNRPFFNKNIFKNLGKELLIFKVIKEINIIHFPIIDDFTTQELNVPAALESYIKNMCTNDEATICLDGYTADFLTFYNWTKLPSGFGTYFPGYREICILHQCNNNEYLELISPEDTEEIINQFDLKEGGNLLSNKFKKKYTYKKINQKKYNRNIKKYKQTKQKKYTRRR
jgi:hypothetical protein